MNSCKEQTAQVLDTQNTFLISKGTRTTIFLNENGI